MRPLLTADNSAKRLAAVLLLSSLLNAVCVAQESEATAATQTDGVTAEQTGLDNAGVMTTPCDPHDAKGAWIDRLHSRLYQITCSSASWFDGLFNDKRYQEDYRATYGNVYVGSVWNQRGDFDKVLRFKARLYLPQMKNRLHAFVGRVDRDEYVTESGDELRELPVAFDRNLEDSTLLGLGYNEPLKKRGSFDTDVGVRTRWPLDPYVKGSYRYAQPIGERNLLRLRETLFWQDTQGYGATTRVDLDRVLTDTYLLRWTASGTVSEVTEGLSWHSTLTLYQTLGRQRALAYEAMANGQTDRRVSLSDYGFSITYRQPLLRSWLWLELRGGVDWPRELPSERRHSNLNGLLALELRYGGQQ